MFSPPCGGGGNKGKNPTPTLPFVGGERIAENFLPLAKGEIKRGLTFSPLRRGRLRGG